MARKTSYQSYVENYQKYSNIQLMHTKMFDEADFYERKNIVETALRAEAFATGVPYSKLSRNLSRQIAAGQREYVSNEQVKTFKAAYFNALETLESGEYNYDEAQKKVIRTMLDGFYERIKKRAISRKSFSGYLENIFPNTKMNAIIQSPPEKKVQGEKKNER